MRLSLKIYSRRFVAILLLLLAIPAAAATYYVDINSPNPTPPYTSWSTASTDIQSAVNQTTNGDLVLVNPGIYNSGGETVSGIGGSNRMAITTPVTVQSVSGPAVTIIQGYQMPGTNNGPNAIRCAYITNGATLSGFTLTGGATTMSTQYGGGVYCQSTACIVSNCVITGNSASANGGGAFQGTLFNCVISSNLILTTSGVSSCYGGGAYGNNLVDCVIMGNSIQAPNNGQGGGTANANVTNCAVANNSVLTSFGICQGGGAYGGNLVNCTITGNSAVEGGGTYNANLINCINVYNVASSASPNYSAGTLNYCCTTPRPGGTGNITNQPLLAGIFEISANSPCRGAGNAAATGGVDINGNPWANPPSIGCEEPDPGSMTGNVNMSIIAPATVPVGYPANFQAYITSPVYYSTWNFGDGTVVTNQAYVSHTWSTISNYTVVLTAYNDSYPTGQVTTFAANVYQPTVFYVAANNISPLAPYDSWAKASTNIQNAVNLAQTGDTVLVTNGFYASGFTKSSDGVSNRVVVTNAIILQSVNGPATTFIVGDNAIRGIYLTNGPVLSGFTITNGTVGQQNCGGVYAASTNILVTNCCITHCSAAAGGGFLGGGRLESCVLSGNSASGSGGAANSDVSGAFLPPAPVLLVLENCVITNNSATFGGGVYGVGYLDVAGCVLNNCLLANNYAVTSGGGAEYVEINNSIIRSNRCDNVGGGVLSGLINYCLISGNSAVHGGGVALGEVPSILNNCTLTNNIAQQDGGGVQGYCFLTNCLIVKNTSMISGPGGVEAGVLVNCTVTGNTNGGISVGTQAKAENCIIYGNTGWDYDSSIPLNYCCTPVLATNGVGNITNAPVFVNPLGGDFHLQPNSPCINSGENAYNNSATDLDGNPRIAGGTVDIGAYEYQTPTSVISYAYLQQYNLRTDGSMDFADLDGTGFNVYQDWIASLNPTNPASVLAMLPPAATNMASGLTISWQSVSGIPYLLQRSTNLSAPFTPLQNITGQAGTTSYTDTTATNPAPYFYRVGVAR